MTANNLDLQTIRKRAEAATKGHWSVIHVAGTPMLTVAGKGIIAQLLKVYDGSKNFEFLENGRDDVLALVEEVERLRAELKSQGNSEVIEEARKLRKELERKRYERDFDWDIGY
jgi:hypothetical protein